jgi:hypothetical protein
MKYCLNYWLTDGGKVVRLTHPPRSTPQKHYYFYVSGSHFCHTLTINNLLKYLQVVDPLSLPTLIAASETQPLLLLVVSE